MSDFYTGEDMSGLLKPACFGTILADPPWQFTNRTGKVAPEHKRLRRYPTMPLEEIMEMPVARIAAKQSHLYFVGA